MNKRILNIFGVGVLVFGVGLYGARAVAQSGSPDSAQKGHHERMSPDQQLSHMSEALNLTDDQKGQIRPILEARQQKMQSLRSDTALAEQDRRAKMQGIFEESNGKIRAVLNDDQKQKFDKMQQQRHDRMEKHAGSDSK